MVDSGTAIAFTSHTSDAVYYEADATLKKLTYAGEIKTETLASSVTQGTYGADVVDNYVFYFGKINDDADAYTFFYDVNGLEGRNAMKFIGKITEADKLSTTESLVIVAQPNKKTYNIGEKLDFTGLIVEAVPYADSEGNRPANIEITVTEDMLSGFDSSTAGASSVTVTYDKKTINFDVTIVDPNAQNNA